VDLYFFDLDKTLYAYDFRRRLPELARLSGVSQYRLARSWWADGYETRAEIGEWSTPDAYLDEFAAVTGGRRLTLEQWATVRRGAMTRIDASVAALTRAAEIGTVALLSNNPPATAASLPIIAPDVAEIVGENALFSCMLGARKPDAELYERALERFGAAPADAFLLDDNLENIEGARAVGLTAMRLEWTDGTPQTGGLVAAIEAFAGRAR
jgi:putative hydrolase of the HAD superfamily